MKFQTNSEEETRELGEKIGELLWPGCLVGLDGTLGSGKTRLTQGIAKGLKVESDSVISPTYTICIPYTGRLPLYHVDAYRINDPTEVDELAFDELLEDGAVLVIEWAERIKDLLPPIDVSIHFDHSWDESTDNRRAISVVTDRAELVDELAKFSQ